MEISFKAFSFEIEILVALLEINRRFKDKIHFLR